MKILHIISSSGMYGAEAVILNLARTLAGGKDLCAIAVFDNAANPNRQLWNAARAESTEAYLIPCSGQIDRTTVATLRSVAASCRADIIHAHGYKADIYSWFAFRNTLPLISTCHTWYDTDRLVRLYGDLDRLVLRGFTSVVAVSEQVRQRLLAAGVRPDRIHMVRNGIDLLPFEGAIPSLRRDLPPGTLLVGLVGRLAWEKGVDIYIRAVARVRAEFPAARFIVVGEGPDRDRLQELAGSLGLGDAVALLGRRDDMPSVYSSLDLMVSASREEGLPMALLEGMASGLPVVATAVGEIPSVVDHGVTGLLVLPNDPAALAAAMLELLRDPVRRTQMSATAQQRIASDYAASRMSKEYVDLYWEAIATHVDSKAQVRKRWGTHNRQGASHSNPMTRGPSVTPHNGDAEASGDAKRIPQQGAMEPDQPSPRVFMMDLWATLPYYTAYLSRALLAEGANVTIGSITYYLDTQCYSSRGLQLRPGLVDLVGRFRLPRLPRRVLKFAESLLNMAALTLRFAVSAPDVVHVQFLPMLTSSLPLDLWFVRYCKNRGSRIVLTVHDLLPHDTGQAHKAVFASLYAEVDALICHSPSIRARLVDEFHVPGSKISVIPHGPFFYDLSAGADQSTHHCFNIPSTESIVLWQGILFPYKGVDILLEAWHDVESRSPAGHLLIIGTGHPDLLDQIRKQVARLDLRRVHLDFRFVSIEELVAAYRDAAIVTYPYRAITTSGALATGLSLGKTIVASDLPVFREVLRDHENALLFQAPNPIAEFAHISDRDSSSAASLATALVELIADPELREALASNIRAMNFGEQTWRAIAAQTLETYRCVVETTG